MAGAAHLSNREEVECGLGLGLGGQFRSEVSCAGFVRGVSSGELGGVKRSDGI